MKRKIKIALWVYWMLLTYIVAALVWWYVSLEKQNKEIHNYKKELQTINVNNSLATVVDIAQQQKRNTTKHIAEGLTFLAIIVLGAVYVYRVVQSQIKASNQQNNFIMAVTHELKTPIAIAQLNVETLGKRKVDEPTQQKLLQNTLRELHRLNDLASNILVVSQLEKDGYAIHFALINISEIVKESINEIKATNPNRKISDNIMPNLNYRADALLIKLVVTNLLDNALKYSPKNEEIQVNLNQSNKFIQLSVADYGQGIPDKEKELIFEKFYRQGNELTRTKKGTGLGLYLCKKIVNDHKGKITVADHQPNGSIFIIRLNQV